MARLTTYPHPSLIGGVSQQPDSLRFDTQARVQDNAWATPVDGLTKRWATRHVAKLIDNDAGAPTLHTINRDAAERYLVATGPKKLQVFDLSGTEVPVFAPGGGGPADLGYLDTSSALDNKLSSPEQFAAPPWAQLNTSIPAASGTLDPWNQFDAVALRVIGPGVGEYNQVADGAFMFGNESQVASLYINPAATTTVATDIALVLEDTVNLTFAKASYNVGTGLVTVSGDPTTTGVVTDVPGTTWKVLSVAVASDDAATPGTVQAGSARRLKVELVGGTGVGMIAWGAMLLEGRSTPLPYFPEESFRALSVADYTFLVNREKTVALEAGVSPGNDANGEAMVFVKSAQNCTQYKLKVTTNIGVYDVEAWTRGTRAHGTVPTTTLSCGLVAVTNADVIEKLAADLRTLAAPLTVTEVDYTSASGSGSGDGGPVMHILGSPIEQVIKVEAWDDKSGDFIVAIQDSVRSITDLPEWGQHGYITTVAGQIDESADDYYVRFVGRDPADTELQEGYWEETLKPGIEYALDASTMPHQLVRQQDDELGAITGSPYGIYFELGPATWIDRAVGDDDSNPAPTFVGRKIEDVFFHSNRLGFISDQNVILSEAGVFFNDWRTGVNLGISDADRVDVAASTTDVVVLRHAVTFRESLLLFSDRTQFTVTGDPSLTPKTAEIRPVFNYETYSSAEPLGVGRGVLFPYKRGAFSGIREIVETQDGFTDLDTSAQIPAYIAGEVTRIAGSSLEDIAVVLADGDPRYVYPYKWFWQGQDKVQSSWGRWDLGADAAVLDASFIEDTLYLVVQRSDGMYLEAMEVGTNLVDDGLTYQVRLDRRLTDAQVTAVYDGPSDMTTVTLPYSLAEATITGEAGKQQLVMVDSVTGLESKPFDMTVGARQVRYLGDLTAASFYVGLAYEFVWEPGEVQLRERQRDGQTTIAGRVNVVAGTLKHADSAYYEVHVTDRDTDTTDVCVFTPETLTLNEVDLESGEFRFPVQQTNDRSYIQVRSKSHLPFRLMSTEWELQHSSPSTPFRG